MAHYGSDTDSADKMLEIARHTLVKMAAGGLQNQVGGGFYRYSVDTRWMMPHFEKMLYDNAQLIPLYLHAALACNEPALLRTARQTCDWVITEMQDPEGGYYSSLDADSEGEEGRFYSWQAKEIKQLLTAEQWRIMCLRYGLDREPNFAGSWHLYSHMDSSTIATQNGLEAAEVDETLDAALNILRQHCNKRIRPGLDDKILTAWNGMMIGAMARAGHVLEAPQYIASATKALDFIRAQLWEDKRLRVTARAGKSRLNAYLDDYVLLAAGIFELLQVRWSGNDLQMLLEIIETVLEHFEDHENGGFYFTSDDHEQLLQRLKPDADDSIPSGNGIAAQLLLKLGYLLAEPRYLNTAEKTLTAMWKSMTLSPSAHGSLLTAMETYLYKPDIIILRGQPAQLQHWLQVTRNSWKLDLVILPIPSDACNLPPALAAKAGTTDGVCVYPCKGTTCHPVITDIDEFRALTSKYHTSSCSPISTW